jgi:hypothetical protein
MNDIIVIDSRIAGSMNDIIVIDSRIAGSMNDIIVIDSRNRTLLDISCVHFFLYWIIWGEREAVSQPPRYNWNIVEGGIKTP